MNEPTLIVGLGNPGIQYELTRHNAGFLVADLICSRFGQNRWQEKFNAQFSRIYIDRHPVILLKPQTFMNLSGRSVQPAAHFFKIDIKKIIIIHDDIDLNYGIVRLKNGGGTGGHKGLNSIGQHLGTVDFNRVRFGIGRPKHGSVADFVLNQFDSDELTDLNLVVEKAADATQSVITHGLSKAMNFYNQRQGD